MNNYLCHIQSNLTILASYIVEASHDDYAKNISLIKFRLDYPILKNTDYDINSIKL